jgi:photosynthetic reaction center cytochrome c subunit
MKMRSILSGCLAIAALATAGMLVACKDDGTSISGTTETQTGYRGTGLVEIQRTSVVKALKAKNVPPPPEDPADPDGKPSTQVYQNIQVLNDLTDNEVMRLMASMTTWVAPEQGCNYCHNPENLADDSIYAKNVARIMIKMTRHINQDWGKHVGATGVTCYTCHRGNPVPQQIWFMNPGPPEAGGMARGREGRGIATAEAAYSSLPYDPLTPLLTNPDAIRVISKDTLVSKYKPTTMETEVTYSLMMHISQALGVNCVYCHNSRAFSNWQQSTYQRLTAWHGFRMVADINKDYLAPVAGLLPASHLGPEGDGPKVACETCHQGVNKPLYGAQMAKDYAKELGPITGPTAQAPTAPAK